MHETFNAPKLSGRKSGNVSTFKRIKRDINGYNSNMNGYCLLSFIPTKETYFQFLHKKSRLQDKNL